MQHLVVETAEPTAAALTEDGWHTNARGKKFHLMQVCSTGVLCGHITRQLIFTVVLYSHYAY